MGSELSFGRSWKNKIQHIISQPDAIVWVVLLFSLFLANIAFNHISYLTTINNPDDFELIKEFRSTNFWGFITNTLFGRFRPMANLLIYFAACLLEISPTLFRPLLLLVNYAVCLCVFYCAFKISGSKYLSFLASLGYLASHLAYYQLTQLFGIMEAFAMAAALVTLCFLFRFINSETDNANRYYLLACVAFFISLFSHERFMALLPLFVFALIARYLMGKKERPALKWRWVILLLIPTAILSINLLIKYLLLNDGILMAGTGQTNIIDSFSFQQFLTHVLSQISILFGFSYGMEEYLGGVTFAAMPVWVWVLIAIYLFALVVLFSMAIVVACKKKETRLCLCLNTLLFVGFIGLCIVASSTTIRLEHRWIYSSLAAWILFAVYLVTFIRQNFLWKPALIPYGISILLVGTIAFIGVELFYRVAWSYMYFTGTIVASTKIQENIIESNEDINENNLIFILDDLYDNAVVFDEFIPEYFTYRKYSPEVFVYDFPNEVNWDVVDENTLLFYQFEDITSMLRANNPKAVGSTFSQINVHYGMFYGHMRQPEASFDIRGTNSGILWMTLWEPPEKTVGQTLTIYVDGQLTQELVLGTTSEVLALPCPKNRLYTVELVLGDEMFRNSIAADNIETLLWFTDIEGVL